MEEQFARIVGAVLLLAVGAVLVWNSIFIIKNKVLSLALQHNWKANRNVSYDISDRILYVVTNSSEKRNYERCVLYQVYICYIFRCFPFYAISVYQLYIKTNALSIFLMMSNCTFIPKNVTNSGMLRDYCVCARVSVSASLPDCLQART
jgi:hypothetical protein